MIKDNSIITGIFTVIGMVTGIIITYICTIKAANRQEFNKAAKTFRKAFVTELIILDDQFVIEKRLETTTFDVLVSAFHKHCIAFLEFRHFIDEIDIFSFNKTWNALYYKYKKQGYDYAFHEEYHSVTTSAEITARNKAVKRINELLEFAKPK